MVRTDRFVGKSKVKDRWEEVGYVIVNQLEDWPVYKVKCPPSENKRKAKYLTLHRNRLMLVPPGDDTPQDPTQLKVVVANCPECPTLGPFCMIGSQIVLTLVHLYLPC